MDNNVEILTLTAHHNASIFLGNLRTRRSFGNLATSRIEWFILRSYFLPDFRNGTPRQSIKHFLNLLLIRIHLEQDFLFFRIAGLINLFSVNSFLPCDQAAHS
ncbi:MAG TPA: hypothetical protein VLL97_04530, partial [Acidobacteriota bacterium]|nr:hypothetical protein [Acidobacteriota bacterium]